MIAVFISCIFKSIYVCYVMYAKIVKQLHVYAITFLKVFCAITNIKIAWINPWLIGYDIDDKLIMRILLDYILDIGSN